MKTLIAVALLAATVATAQAQYNDQRGEFDRQQEYRRQQEQIEAQQRRMAEIERQQRAEQERRNEAERHRSNPFISESQRQGCRPGQILC